MKLPTTPSFRLEGKRAMVAGGSSGIGLGCAVALAEAGAHVVIMARRSDLINQTVTAMLKKELSAEGFVGDITDVNITAALIARSRASYQSLSLIHI